MPPENLEQVPTSTLVRVHDWRLEQLEKGQDQIMGSLTALHQKVDALPCPTSDFRTGQLELRIARVESKVTDLRDAKTNWKAIAATCGGVAVLFGLSDLLPWVDKLFSALK